MKLSTKGLVFGVILAAGTVGCGRKEYIPGPQGPRGEKGEPGVQGSSPIIEVVDPCGDASGVIDEILIRLNDGRVLCSFSDQANGKNTRLSILPAGSYVTTDGSDCAFTIDEDGSIQ